MKRIFLLTLVLGVGCLGLNAQTWSGSSLDGDTYRNGNVGIGVTTPTNSKLHIYRNATIGAWSSITTSNAGLRIQDSGANMYIDGNTIYSDQNMNFGSLGNRYISFGTNNMERLRIDETGNVGIGKYNPEAKLDISGNIRLTDEITFSHVEKDLLTKPRTGIKPMSIRLWDNYNDNGPTNYGTTLEIYGRSSHQTCQFYFGGWDNSKIRYREAFYNDSEWNKWHILLDSENDVESNGNLRIKGSGIHYIENGNVGIGTTNPEHKLEVAGTIHTQEVKVDMNGWSDFVFHPTYNLRPLQEVNAYIQQNGHLPEIPTAKEVEENGISLGEMNAKLLQKIEELTLYTIEQEKEIKGQNERIEKLEEIIKKLQ